MFVFAEFRGTWRVLINPDKTIVVVFGTRQMQNLINLSPIMFLGKEVKIADVAKDLGVILVSQLMFNDHFSSLASSLMANFAQLTVLATYLIARPS